MNSRYKKILYRSTHRGLKEADTLLGGFVFSQIRNLDDHDLKGLEELLNEPDAKIIDWILKKTPLPLGCKRQVLKKIIQSLGDS